MKRILVSLLLCVSLILSCFSLFACDTDEIPELPNGGAGDHTTADNGTGDNGNTGDGENTGDADEDAPIFPDSLFTSQADFLPNYTSDDFENLKAMVAEMNTAATEENLTNEELVALDDEIGAELVRLANSLSLYQIAYYADTTNDVAFERYNNCDGYYTEFWTLYEALYAPMAVSCYREVFFEDMTDEEIADMVANAVTDPALVELTNRKNEYENTFDNLTDDQIDGVGFDYNTFYKNYIEVSNEIAAMYGYDNYLDFAYAEVFSRDFTYESVLNYVNGLNDNLMPLTTAAYNELTALMKTISEEDYYGTFGILDASFSEPSSRVILDGFYRSLGDEIYGIYQSLWENGYYYIASDKNAMQTAFTSTFMTEDGNGTIPYLFFSQSYATVGTFVHEFGHYCNMYLADGRGGESYEVMESQSQGAEWLFYAYLATSGILNDDQARLLVLMELYDSSFYVVLGGLLGAMDIAVYTETLPEKPKFNNIMRTVIETAFPSGFPSNFLTNTDVYYYYRVCSVGNSQAYYISYSLSLISSIEIFAQAIENYAAGAATYCELLGYSSDYLATLTEIGLCSPFTTEAFNIINNAFFAEEESASEAV
ncbi:MAG: hypothetical protein PUJ21_06805 [Clostridia bacterium]|nr:hypothetical protein [Clostridia bacterium]MDY6184834.1 hypothetical protein [Eubacteriales bacterium]